MVARAFNLRTLEAMSGGSLGVSAQPSFQREYQDSQGCDTEKSCLKKSK